MNDCANPHLPCFLEAYSRSSQASMMKAFGKLSKQLLAVDYFSQKLSHRCMANTCASVSFLIKLNVSDLQLY